MAGILLVGNLRSSLTIARRLARAGHEVHCGVDELDPFLFTSRHIRGVLWHPPVDTGAEGALRAFSDYLDQHPEIEALYPVSDVSTRLISRNRWRFAPRVRLILAEERVVAACIDKPAMFDLCDRLGVPIARRLMAHDYASLAEAVAEIGRPCVVKPIGISKYLQDEKALVIRHDQTLADVIPVWPEGHQTLCVQAFATGARHDVDFAAHKGRLLGAVQVKARRTDRYDGTGHMIEKVSVVPMPAVVKATETLVAALNYTGVGNIQFMVDEQTGRISYLENNPRLAAGFRSAEVCGLPLALWNYEIWSGRPPKPRKDPWSYPVGRRVVWTKGDLSGLAKEWRRGALTPRQAAHWAAEALLGVFSPRHLSFSLTDPMPTFWMYVQAPLKRLGIAPGTRKLRRGQNPLKRSDAAPQPWPVKRAA